MKFFAPFLFLTACSGHLATVATACELSGQWRSTLGVLDLREVRVADGFGNGPGVTGDHDNAPPALRPGQVGLLGTFHGPAGNGRFWGVREDDTLRLELAFDGVGEGDVQPGAAALTVDDDCLALSGTTTSPDGGRETFVARRIASVAANPGDRTETMSGAQGTLARGLDVTDKLLRAVAGDQEDAITLPESVGTSPATALGFVAENIAYEPYPGALRGARGALYWGKGNAVDRVLLLADILRSAGHDVRFAMGSLPRDAALRLVASARGGGARPSTPARDLAVKAALDDADRFLGDPPAGSEFPAIELVQAARVQAERILPILPPPPDVRVDDAGRRQVQMVARHVWVQVRQGEDWVDLDPTMPGALAGQAFADIEGTTPTLPASWYQTVSLTLLIERNGPEGLETAIAGSWQVRPAALAEIGFPLISLHFVPLDIPNDMGRPWTRDQLDQARAEMRAQLLDRGENFQPVLRVSDGRALAGDPFSLSGELVSDDWRTRAPLSMGRSTGGLLGDLADRIANPEAPSARSPGALLTGVRLEFEIAAPGLEPIRESRWLLDLVGPGARAGAEASRSPDLEQHKRLARAALASPLHILISPDAVPASALAQRLLADAPARRAFWTRALAISEGRTPFNPRDLQPPPEAGLELAALSRTDSILAEAAWNSMGIYLMRDGPQVLTMRDIIVPGPDEDSDRMSVRLDLVHVGRMPVVQVGTEADDIRRAQAVVGLAMTAAEDWLAADRARRSCDGCDDAARPSGAFSRIVSAPGFEAGPAALERSGNAQLDAMVAAEMERGHDVLVATGANAWLRIDPRSQAMLGMTPEGGEGSTEYAIIASMTFFPRAWQYVGLKMLSAWGFVLEGFRENFMDPVVDFYRNGGYDYLPGDNPDVSPKDRELQRRLLREDEGNR